jgi:hypothetical protein
VQEVAVKNAKKARLADATHAKRALFDVQQKSPTISATMAVFSGDIGDCPGENGQILRCKRAVARILAKNRISNFGRRIAAENRSR